MSFVIITRDEFSKFLTAKGFKETTNAGEIVFSRAHHIDPRYRVLIYTSIRFGNNQTRAVGKDAIRVCAIVSNKVGNTTTTHGVAKLRRVHRTGTVDAVLERTLARMREAYAVCNKIINQGKFYERNQNAQRISR